VPRAIASICCSPPDSVEARCSSRSRRASCGRVRKACFAMATDTLPSSAPRPPGSAGLPGLGETLTFVKDPFTFIRERRARHGRVFRTSLLGRSMAILIGPEPLEAFYDPANVVREGANPANIQTLFGGTGVINGLDGAAHASRKGFVSAALSRDAVESYLPTMTRFVDAAFARWTSAGEIVWNEELKRLAIETLGADQAERIAAVSPVGANSMSHTRPSSVLASMK